MTQAAAVVGVAPATRYRVLATLRVALGLVPGRTVRCGSQRLARLLLARLADPPLAPR